jgi:hypothetical protein
MRLTFLRKLTSQERPLQSLTSVNNVPVSTAICSERGLIL